MKRVLAIILLCSIFITGCTNKKYEEMMTNGKTAVANGEYEKAEKFFSLALEEKSNDKEANALENQIIKLNEVLELKKNKKYNEVITLCDEINKIESDSDIIKKASKLVLTESKKLLNTCKENINKQEPKKKEEYTKNQIQNALEVLYNVNDSNGATYIYTDANESYIAGESEAFKSKYYVFSEQYGDAMSDCNYLVDKQTFEVYLYFPGGELQKIS